MPDLTQLTLYLAAALLLAVAPGPGIFYVAARTLAGGRAEGVASSFGTGLGGLVHVLAGSLAVSAIVVAFAAGGVRQGAAARPALIRRLREASGAAMIALGVGLALARRPAN